MKNTTKGNMNTVNLPKAPSGNSEAETISVKTACSSRASKIIESVICDTLGWIDDHLGGNLQAARLAERAGYTRWHFQRMFKEMTGCTLSDYVRHRRLEKVAEALVSTDDFIVNIACQYGYTSQKTMSRMIRDHYGISPTEMRRQAIKRRDTVCQSE